MNYEHLRCMAEEVTEHFTCGQDAEDVAPVLELLRKYWQNHIALVWDIWDIHRKAEEMGVELTDEQAQDILDTIYADHDASVGVNWDVIETNIEFYLAENV